MNSPLLPLIVEPAELEASLGNEQILIVDLCKPEVYARRHVSGAVHLDYGRIVAARPPIMGLLPDDAQLSAVLSSIGLTAEMHVVAYDDEGGGHASRLLWTLEVVGHRRYCLLNGGLHAWMAERRPVSDRQAQRRSSDFRVHRDTAAVADLSYIRAHLDDPALALVDARSYAEYSGQKRLAQRGGHIPGAVNFDWVNAMDPQTSLRLKPAEVLRRDLAALGVTPGKDVIVYCHTHHRSAHTYMVLKSLGFDRVKGYPGSWSEWGNQPETPVE